MPITENKIEYPAERLAKTLQEFNLRNEQERLKQEEKNKNQEKENKLFNTLSANQTKIQELISSQLNTLSANQSKIQELVDFQQGKENEKFKFLADQIIKLNERNLETIKQIRINYKDLLGKPQLITSSEVERKIAVFLESASILNRQEVSLLIQNHTRELKVDYRNLLNKPNLLSEKDVNRLILEYSKKIEDLFQIESDLSNVKIEELKREYQKVKESEAVLSKTVDKLKEEQKKLINVKMSSASSPFYEAHDTGYDYATVRMSKMKSITSNYPASTSDFGILANAVGGVITITLPSAIKTGQVLAIKKIDSSTNAITINPSGTETIEGASSLTLSVQYESRWLVSGGNSIWYAVSSTGAAGIGTETPSGTKNGVNVTFTVSHIPAFLTFNGQMLYEGNGFSRSGLTLTLDLAPLSTDIIKSHY